jgi:hypothetical protein
MVLIKINIVPSSRKALKERVERAWRINPNRLYNQDTLIVTYSGEILEVYKILSYKKDSIEDKRIAFELEEIDSDLKGKKIVTKTPNPCTIIHELKFKDIQ